MKGNVPEAKKFSDTLEIFNFLNNFVEDKKFTIDIVVESESGDATPVTLVAKELRETNNVNRFGASNFF